MGGKVWYHVKVLVKKDECHGYHGRKRVGGMFGTYTETREEGAIDATLRRGELTRANRATRETRVRESTVKE